METTDMQAIREARQKLSVLQREIDDHAEETFSHEQSDDIPCDCYWCQTITPMIQSIETTLDKIDKIDKSGEGEMVIAHINIDPNASEETKRAVGEMVKSAYSYKPQQGTGKVLTDEEAELMAENWMKDLAGFGRDGVVMSSMMLTPKHLAQFLRDKGYLAPAKAPAEVVEKVVDAIRSAARPRCSDHTSYYGACVTCGSVSNPIELPSVDRVIEAVRAALKSNTPEHGN